MDAETVFNLDEADTDPLIRIRYDFEKRRLKTANPVAEEIRLR
jgi:hypothetical protein